MHSCKVPTSRQDWTGGYMLTASCTTLTHCPRQLEELLVVWTPSKWLTPFKTGVAGSAGSHSLQIANYACPRVVAITSKLGIKNAGHNPPR
jgi:hypothetical protein